MISAACNVYFPVTIHPPSFTEIMLVYVTVSKGHASLEWILSSIQVLFCPRDDVVVPWGYSFHSNLAHLTARHSYGQRNHHCLAREHAVVDSTIESGSKIDLSKANVRWRHLYVGEIETGRVAPQGNGS
jgi:hypothetical protein